MTLISNGRTGWLKRGNRHPDASVNAFAAMSDLQLAGVRLVAATAGGPVEVPDLGIAFDSPGVTVRKPDGVTAGLIPWSSLRHLLVVDAGQEPHARGATSRLEVESDRRRHVFLVSGVEPRVLAGALAAISSRHCGRDLTRADDQSADQRRAQR